MGTTIGAIALAVIVGWRAYQRRAVSECVASGQLVALADYLPKPDGTEVRTSIKVLSDSVIVHVEVRTQEEFDQLVKASQRQGRPRYERLELVWQGVQYEL